jgi:glycosyltransferase involved in cell wall biosynthesis
VWRPRSKAVTDQLKHINVCVCTYKRTDFLKRLLTELGRQDTHGLFSYSIVVADNDNLESARPVVSNFAAASPISVRYCVEPLQNIALARNMAVANAGGDFVAFIDDDEFPEKNWLLYLLQDCEKYSVAGVLGPVKRHFDEIPPKWILKSSFYSRPIHPTGMVVDWHEARTGNVLLRKMVFDAEAPPFRPEFRAGEDQDFFRRMIEKGHVFVWSDRAIVYEIIPPIRWKRTFMLRKALLRGATARLQPSCTAGSIAKSLIAVPLYMAALPIAFVLGHHRLMIFLVKLFDHLGKVLAALGINPIKEPYVTN